jgi:hypothetical protein
MRTKAPVLFGALVSLAVASCAMPPVAVHSGEQCYRCRRPILDERAAGELIQTGTFPLKFRAPGCMAKYLVSHPDDRATAYVTDFVTGKMMSPDHAFFVPIVVNSFTDERDYRAYRLKTDADAAAIDAHSVPVDWKTVIEKARS